MCVGSCRLVEVGSALFVTVEQSDDMRRRGGRICCSASALKRNHWRFAQTRTPGRWPWVVEDGCGEAVEYS